MADVAAGAATAAGSAASAAAAGVAAVAGKADPFGPTGAFLGDSISDNSSGSTTGIGGGDPTKTTRARGYFS